ncbi:MAG: mannitol dehydrogenase [Clostridia bacterium]|nr:mannitol dehydrogenase [Clostridia bacterium]MBR2908578.1 mannitol dehydrogenase [Clostridia bacterium]
MNAVMYGAGNIGRGFIGQRLYLSGYHTTFIDVNDTVVRLLNEEKRYPIFVTRGTEYVPEWVENIDAVDGKDKDAVVTAIEGCDLLCTALGVPILPRVAPLIAEAVVKRLEQDKPLNVLICENMIGSNEYLHGLVEPLIPDEYKTAFEEKIGFVCVSVGRTVPPTPEDILEKYPLAACAEPYSELPVDASGFRPVGCEYPPILELVPFSPFRFFIERKLLIHNMGHALQAYYGYVKGLNYIFEAATDGEIKYVLTRALLESARALCKRHGAPLDETMQFVEDLMVRFENKLLVDSFDRVGRDPKRKLSENDRLVGAFKMVKEEGGVPAHIAVGIAAGYLFAEPSDPAAVEITDYVKENGLEKALLKYSNITDADDVKMIRTFYDLFVSKAPFTRFVETLAEMKSVNAH